MEQTIEIQEVAVETQADIVELSESQLALVGGAGFCLSFD